MSGQDIAVVGGASVFLLIGVLLFGLGARNCSRAVASPQWPRTDGVVTVSNTSRSVDTDSDTSGSSTMYSTKVRFHYQVNGSEYTTDTVHFGQTSGSGSASDAELEHLRYPAGAKVRVSYDPKDPSIAAVQPGFDSDALWLPGAGLAFFVPGVMVIVLYFGMTQGDDLMGVGLKIFAGIFASLGFALLAGGSVNLWRGYASQSWPRTPGVIVYGIPDPAVTNDSEPVAEREGEEQLIPAASSDGHVIYRYQVNGSRYYGNVRLFGQLAGSSGDWESNIAARYPLGKTIPVVYSPANPSVAALETGIDREAWWLPGAGAAVLAFALAIFIWAIPALTR